MRSKRLVLGFAAAFLVCAAPAHAGLFGESDEEKAARQHEKDQDSAISDLTQRVHDLEDSLSRSTGQNETLTHQIQQLNDKISRQQKDFEYRLCQLAQQQLGTGQGDEGQQSTLSCAGGNGGGVSQSYNPPPVAQRAAPQPQPQGSGLAPPPGVLGTLPAKSANAVPPADGGNPQARAQFNAALDLLAKARYDEARAAFRGFADANPDDTMTPEAVYWVGDIEYVQKDYAGAARTFVEQMKKYPASTRGPQSMLKLGQSLIAMGQTKEGCQALGALPTRYPNASKQIASQAASERKASCH